MAKKNYFTDDEIVLCTYAALYDAEDFGGVSRIEKLTNRSRSSIKMKIQNIAAFHEAGIRRHSRVSPLTGLTTGRSGRTTNWKTVEPLAKLTKQSLFEKCCRILGN
jgi:hypothetical protein